VASTSTYTSSNLKAGVGPHVAVAGIDVDAVSGRRVIGDAIHHVDAVQPLEGVGEVVLEEHAGKMAARCTVPEETASQAREKRART